jgi:hypothetical protein
MGVAHPSPIPSFDVQSAAGAGCRSFVTAEIASLSATVKPGPSPSDRSAPALSEEATELDRRRPVPLGLAVRSLGRLAVCPGDREAGDRDCLASQRLPAVLDLEGAAGQTRASSRTALPSARSRPDLRRRLHQTGPGFRHQGSAGGTAVALATSLCRARDRINPARVPRPCDRLQRSLATSNPSFVFRLLSRIENAPLPGEGLPGTTARASAGDRAPYCHTASWRSSPPVRAARSLNLVRLHPGPSRGQVRLDLRLLEDRAAVRSPAADPGCKRRSKTRPPQSRSRLATCLRAAISFRRRRFCRIRGLREPHRRGNAEKTSQDFFAPPLGPLRLCGEDGAATCLVGLRRSLARTSAWRRRSPCESRRRP